MDRSGILKWEEKGRVGVIKISSDNKSNTIPKPDFADCAKVKQWLCNEDIEGVIVTGEGRHFSSGADLEYFKSNDFKRDEIEKQFAGVEEILNCLATIDKPVVAAIEGACLGAGFEIALACQMRVCSKSALFGFPEITHGIIPGYGGLQRLLEIAGKSKTLEIALTGDVFGAEYARQFGIVNAVTDDKAAFDYTCSFINKIIEMGRKPVKYTIRSVNNASNIDFRSAVREECHMFAELVIDQYVNGRGIIGSQEENKIAD